ncbi:hypothetical protein LTR50_006838 [Elasticomyces elasticus]|nr:hypothetical protein LTR50_006838 [Elasticomyces elasticus]
MSLRNSDTDSNSSYNSHSTAPTDYSIRPPLIHQDTRDARHEGLKDGLFDDDNVDARTSMDTYASTIPSCNDLEEDVPEYEVPAYRQDYCYSDALPATPQDFAELFPSHRRLLIRHDDSTLDGNMNLRIDCQVALRGGRMRNITLFHLRMHDLKAREFSLRRYCRDSGREVCHSVRRYHDPAEEKRPGLQRSLSTALASFRFKPENKILSSSLKRADSGYQSMHSSDGSEINMSPTSEASSKFHSQLPTNATKLEFSNYAQIDVKRRGANSSKRYEFEYWGADYRWRRVATKNGDLQEISYQLTRLNSDKALAHIVPMPMTAMQLHEERARGGWIPPCQMWISDSKIANRVVDTDVADVIVASGLIALTDDCIKRRFHSKQARQVLIPVAKFKMGVEYVGPRRLINDVFIRSSKRGSVPA